jgi:hypothetical protein
MEIIGFYNLDGKNENVYVVKTKNGFYYITNINQSEIYEWFIVDKVIKKYCVKRFENFKFIEK